MRRRMNSAAGEASSFAAVVRAPFAHRHSGAEAKRLVECDTGTVAAHGCDGPDVGIGAREKRKDLLEPHMLDFVMDRMPHRLAETQVEQTARTWGPVDDVPRRQATARFAADGFHGRKNMRRALAGAKS